MVVELSGFGIGLDTPIRTIPFGAPLSACGGYDYSLFFSLQPKPKATINLCLPEQLRPSWHGIN